MRRARSPVTIPSSRRGVGPLTVLAATLGARTALADPPVVVHPSVIDASTEIVNPMRGYFRWYDQEQVPQPRPSYDSYTRYEWRALEPTEGAYDFSAIESDMVAAHAAGRRFGFRVMPVNVGDGTAQVPQYVIDQGLGEWCSANAFTPHWNDAGYLARARALSQALGARYDGDPRLAYYDMGLYGHWGEWHTYGLCGPDGTSATKHALVDMQIDAFPHTRVLMNSGGGEVDAFVYALGRSPRIGVRCDSFGNVWFDQQFMNDPTKWAAVRDRWMTAPIVAEYFGGSSNDYGLAITQVGDLHVALIGNGNFDWSSLSGDQQNDATAAGRAAGYRFVLATASFAPTAQAGAAWALDTDWSNVGATPAYEAWTVTWELRDAAGHVAASSASSLDPQRLLPTTTPAHTHDVWTLPASLAAGHYTLDIGVLDPSGYRAPLALAIQGRDANGRYPLGAVTVAPAGPGTDAGAPDAQTADAGPVGACAGTHLFCDGYTTPARATAVRSSTPRPRATAAPTPRARATAATAAG